MATLNDILVNLLMSDVELSYLETLVVSRKFNLVLLYKDQRKEIIEGLDIILLEDTKKLLSANNIQQAEGRPLNWAQIMKEVRENPQQFSEAGGWGGLKLGMTSDLMGKNSGHFLSSSSNDKKGQGSADEDDTEVRKDGGSETRLEEISDKTSEEENITNTSYNTESEIELEALASVLSDSTLKEGDNGLTGLNLVELANQSGLGLSSSP